MNTFENSELYMPDYPYLVKNGIEFPELLVKHGIAAGLIHLPPPHATIPRCPCGKKAAETARQLALRLPRPQKQFSTIPATIAQV